MTDDVKKVETLLYQCVVVQPTEGQFRVGAPVEAERSWNNKWPYLFVQGVAGMSVKFSDSVENFRSGVSSVLEQLLEAQGRKASLQDIEQRLVTKGYNVRQLPTKQPGTSPKTL